MEIHNAILEGIASELRNRGYVVKIRLDNHFGLEIGLEIDAPGYLYRRLGLSCRHGRLNLYQCTYLSTWRLVSGWELEDPESIQRLFETFERITTILQL